MKHFCKALFKLKLKCLHFNHILIISLHFNCVQRQNYKNDVSVLNIMEGCIQKATCLKSYVAALCCQRPSDIQQPCLIPVAEGKSKCAKKHEWGTKALGRKTILLPRASAEAHLVTQAHSKFLQKCSFLVIVQLVLPEILNRKLCHRFEIQVSARVVESVL